MGQVRRCWDLCDKKHYDHTRKRGDAHHSNCSIDSEFALHTEISSLQVFDLFA